MAGNVTDIVGVGYLHDKFKEHLPFLAIGGTCVAVLVLAEICLRVVGFGHPLVYRPSAAGYELAANQTSTRLGHTTHINAFGLRGPETTPLPAPGTERILSLGDSVANGGTQINDVQSYPAVLQADLTRAGRSVEVVNAASGGWSVENELAWLQEHGTFGAATVVLEVNEKDLDEAFIDQSILDVNPAFPSHYPESAIGELLGRYVAPKVGLAKPAIDPGSTPTGVNTASEAALIPTIAKIRDIAKAANATLTIMYWDPHYPAVPSETVTERAKLFAFAKANNIAVVRPNLSARPDWNRYFRDRMHPNSLGNQIIATDLAPVLK